MLNSIQDDIHKFYVSLGFLLVFTSFGGFFVYQSQVSNELDKILQYDEESRDSKGKVINQSKQNIAKTRADVAIANKKFINKAVIVGGAIGLSLILTNVWPLRKKLIKITKHSEEMRDLEMQKLKLEIAKLETPNN